MNYEKLMLRAISNANFYKFTAKPNPVVGAILVKGEEIISEGYHEKFGQNHAEINAINLAKKKINKNFNDFSELVLICTLEPCSHIGKTGSCAHAIVNSGIKKVIIGSIDPNPLVSGKGVKILEDGGIKVEKNLCAELVRKQNKYFFFKQTFNRPYLTVKIASDPKRSSSLRQEVKILEDGGIKVEKNLCAELVRKQNKYFFFKQTFNRPYLTVKIASSSDGKSHYKDSERTYITSDASRNDVQILRAEHDGILTGGNTLRNDNPQMNARVNFDTNQPQKILLSNQDINEDKYEFFKNNSANIHSNQSLDEVIEFYKNSDLCSILIEAGPDLVNAFLKTGKVDEIVIYTSNKVLGDEGVDWFKEKNAIENYGFKLESSYKIGGDVKETFIKNEKK